MADVLMTDLHNSVLCKASVTRRAYLPYAGSPGHLRTDTAFHGQPREAKTGHYLLGQGKRVYIPTLARFAMPDRQSPFGLGGCNAYAYCLGDPVNRTDPSGETSVFAVAKQLVWLGARAKAIAAGVSGLKFISELAKWGGRLGNGLATMGIPGGAAVALLSNTVALSVKALTVGKALLRYVRPKRLVGSGHRSGSGIRGLSGSTGQLMYDPVNSADFSPFVGYLPNPVDFARHPQ